MSMFKFTHVMSVFMMEQFLLLDLLFMCMRMRESISAMKRIWKFELMSLSAPKKMCKHLAFALAITSRSIRVCR
ncbi:hypothetical protein D3C85_1614840 [compost metagenome]